jgi:hypothetical protein
MEEMEMRGMHVHIDVQQIKIYATATTVNQAYTIKIYYIK